MNPDKVTIQHPDGAPASTARLPYRDALLSIEREPRMLRIEAIPDAIDLAVQALPGAIEVRALDTLYTLALPAEHLLHITTGNGDDKVLLACLPATQAIIETRGGNDAVQLKAAAEGAGSVVVDTGLGNDHIVTEHLALVQVDAGQGDDVIASNAAHAILYAGEGDDTVQINAGRAIIEAMSGTNAISTGRGDTRLFGHPGSVTAVQGFDAPLLSDAWNAPLPADYAATFEIRGDADYISKVTCQLNILRATQTASTLLEDLVARKARVVIEPTSELDNAFAGFGGAQGDPTVRNGKRGDRILHTRIGYNPLAQRPGAPALVMLYHELCHVWNFTSGSVLGDRERQAVGLDSGEWFDFDDDPLTPPTCTNPFPFNENALRDELGLPQRESYQ